MKKKTEVIESAVLGLAIADAMASSKTDKTSSVKEGTWGGNTTVALAVLDALNKSNWKNGALLYDIIMQNLAAANNSAEFTCCNSGKGLDANTVAAINKYTETLNPNTCGDVNADTDYTLISYLALVACVDGYDDHMAVNICRLLNSNEKYTLIGLAYKTYAKCIYDHNTCKDVDEVYKYRILRPVYHRIFTEYRVLADMIINTAYTEKVDKNLKLKEADKDSIVLARAFWCLLSTDDYISCVNEALKFDTHVNDIAAAAGALAGMYYGMYSNTNKKGIKKEYIKKLLDSKQIYKLLDDTKAVLAD